MPCSLEATSSWFLTLQYSLGATVEQIIAAARGFPSFFFNGTDPVETRMLGAENEGIIRCKESYRRKFWYGLQGKAGGSRIPMADNF